MNDREFAAHCRWVRTEAPRSTTVAPCVPHRVGVLRGSWKGRTGWRLAVGRFFSLCDIEGHGQVWISNRSIFVRPAHDRHVPGA